jgi:CHAT domain-containing protein/tetratricopeptide (TPR) repeat protein
MTSSWIARVAGVGLVWAMAQPVAAQTRNLQGDAAAGQIDVAPAQMARSNPAATLPPTIADLVLLLQSYKPDLARVQRLRADMLTEPAATADAATLAVTWHKKALAAEELQEVELRQQYLATAIDYAQKANGTNLTDVGGLVRLKVEFSGHQSKAVGITAMLDGSLQLAQELEGTNQAPGQLIGIYQKIINGYVHLGDVSAARQVLTKMENLLNRLASKRGRALYVSLWTNKVESSRAVILMNEGKPAEAERTVLAALRQNEETMRTYTQRSTLNGWTPPEERVQENADGDRINLAQIYLSQDRYNESELLLREVLKRSLIRDGRNSLTVGRVLMVLSKVFTNRGRYAEANVLAEWSVRTLQEAGLGKTSPPWLNANLTLANSLVPVNRIDEAVALMDKLRASISDDSRLEEGFGSGTLLSIRAYILANRLEDALRDGNRLLQHNTKHLGLGHYATAEARAYRAMALHRTGQLPEARREFELALQTLLDPAKAPGKQASVARANRLKLILNEYLNVLVGVKGQRNDKDIAEAFRVADVARWQSVQKAIAGSALRSASGTPELAVQIKRVQDAEDEMQAVYKNLISQRSAPPEKQLPAVIAAMETRIATLQKQQQSDLQDIRRKFPQYDALVNPRPVDLATTRKSLQANEALLSIYVTPGGTYVWAIGPDGSLRFHFSDKNATWIAQQVKKLRDSVDLTTGLPVERLRFDLQAGANLYQHLMAPVELAWDKADTLLVVANESLGQIPFSLLPTVAQPEAVRSDNLPLSQYRSVPWLARKVAIAYLPSVSALVTQRKLPAANARRAAFIGYGDPDFGATAKGPGTRSAGARTRNLAVKRAPAWDENQTTAEVSPPPTAAAPPSDQDEEPQLGALPDTRDEIMAIATALSANVQSDTFFGTQANRSNVLNADLKNRRVVAFATHGLVAGDLPGLDQPALALTPGAGGRITDGLLTLEDIMKLSLDADLVVLSACNTAAADGTGAEAVSGLGRGFFYAGARAVLATHWPVETVSARQLVSVLFERYSQDPKLSRAHALRRAMLQLLDVEVATAGSGQAVNAYAHPAFWAPYALYGDPGR